MDKKKQALREKIDAAKAIRGKAKDENRELTAEELGQIEALAAETRTLKAEIELDEKRAADAADIDQAEAFLNAAVRRQTTSAATTELPVSAGGQATIERPGYKGRARRILSASPGLSQAEANERAYRFGQWCLSALGRPESRKWCAGNGLMAVADHNETLNYSGGYLVPEEFDSMLIDLRESYGIFRQYAKVRSMTRDVLHVPRRATGLTAYFVGEQAAGTKSNKTWDQISLVAKKMMCLALYSNELNADAIINLGDDLAGEIAYAFANKEDDCGFNGTGTSTYGGIVGLAQAFANLSGTVNNIAGWWSAGGASNSGKDTWPEIVLGDFNNVVGLLPQYADTPNTRWFMHKTFWGAVAQNLLYAAGGNTTGSMAAGTPASLMGYPVVFTQVMPKVTAVGTIFAYLGDLSLAADFGDRSGVSVAFSDSAVISSTSAWETDQIAIRGVERMDINVHDVGNASATAGSRQPGPIVCLATSAT